MGAWVLVIMKIYTTGEMDLQFQDFDSEQTCRSVMDLIDRQQFMLKNKLGGGNLLFELPYKMEMSCEPK